MSAAAKALHHVLALAETAETQIIVIGYRDNFERLWQFEEDLSGKTVFILWDETPRIAEFGNVDTSRHLSPLTWAVCAMKARTAAHLVILDLHPGQHLDESRLYRFVETIRPERMPWLRLVPLPAFGRFLTEHFVLNTTGGAVATNNPLEGEMLEMLAREIHAKLTQPGHEGDHHAIQNIIGPHVLCGSQYSASRGMAERALLQLSYGVGLLESERVASFVPSGNRDWPIQSWGSEPLRLLLVDDQWEAGWGNWVESSIPDEKKTLVTIERAKRPDFLVDKIEQALEQHTAGHDARFELNLGRPTDDGQSAAESADDRRTVLLLDLRLFAHERPVSNSTEVRFYRETLLPLCERLVEAEDCASRLAWPGFKADELNRVRSWCEHPDRDHVDYLLALTLLPRLIALTDFSLPIVLFSNTTQRAIAEILKPYGSIITDFWKPRFSVGRAGSEIVSEAMEGFAHALQRARNMLSARRKCLQLLRLIPTKQKPPESSIASNREYYLELFLDEGPSDRANIPLGGCFALFDGQNFREARRKAYRFDDWLVSRGLRYFDSRKIGIQPSSELLSKGNNPDLAPYLREALKQPNSPCRLGLVRLRNVQAKGDGESMLFRPGYADNRYHQTLRALLELFLAETMPALLGDPQVVEKVFVSIYVATRVFDIGDKRLQSAAMANFGINRHSAIETRFYSLDRPEVYPLVAEILDQRGIKRQTNRLLAVAIPYDGAGCGSLPKAEYFICASCDCYKKVELRESDPSRHLSCSCRSKNSQPSHSSTQSPVDVAQRTPSSSISADDGPSWRPDYYSLHYVADEAMRFFPDGSPGADARRYAQVFGSQTAGGFDALLDAETKATLNAGRRLDKGDLVSAIAQSPIPSARVEDRMPSASYWLALRVANSLASLTGNEFVRLASLMAADVE